MDKQNVLIGIGLAVVVLLGVLIFRGSGSSDIPKADQVQTNVTGTNTATPVTPTPTTPNQNVTTVDPAKATSVTYAETEFDFGTVNEGEKVRHTYKFTNSGDKPLEISNAKGSCGCTVPQWPKEPIAPGESSEIIVEFNSKGKAGKQTKTVTITANTNPPTSTLRISGEVLKAEGTADKTPAAPAGK